ncbi:MAG: hypothetical protein HUJ95_00145, partial [Bacteroidales bacterium]|nr:hypothetical protein [Bacteroidales bacterium]
QIDESCRFNAKAISKAAFIVVDNSGTVKDCANYAPIVFENAGADITSAVNIGAIVANNAATAVVDHCSNTGNITIKWTDAQSQAVYAGGVVGYTKAGISNCQNSGAVTSDVTQTAKSVCLGGVVGCTPATKLGTGNTPPTNYGLLEGCRNFGEVYHYVGVVATGSYCNVGGVAGYWEGNVKTCSNSGKVHIATSEENTAACCTRPAVGGVCASVLFSAENCHNTGAVSIDRGVFAAGTDGNALAGGYYQVSIGGVFGQIGIRILDSNNYIKDCHNGGKVSLNLYMKQAGGTRSCTAGVAGYCSVIATNCYNVGPVDANVGNKIGNVGGVFGIIKASMTDCYNNATVTVNSRWEEADPTHANAFGNQFYIGGVYGYVDNAATNDCTFTNIENRSNGTVAYHKGWNNTVYSYIGGVGGAYNKGYILNGAKNEGKVIVDCPNAMVIGGVTSTINSKIANATNNGEIKVTKATATQYDKCTCVGGITGYFNALVENCTSNGSISVSDVQVADTCKVHIAGIMAQAGDANFVDTEEVKTAPKGNVVACAITADASTTRVGAVFGQYRYSPTDPSKGTVYSIDLGTADSPIVVKSTAKINGATPTAANICAHPSGNGHNVNTTNVKFE